MTHVRNKLIECPEPGILFTHDNAMWAYHALKDARTAGRSIPEQDELCDKLAAILFPRTENRALYREARGWISDCQWGDYVDIAELSDAEVRAGIERHYEGGWAAFTAASEPVTKERQLCARSMPPRRRTRSTTCSAPGPSAPAGPGGWT